MRENSLKEILRFKEGEIGTIYWYIQTAGILIWNIEVNTEHTHNNHKRPTNSPVVSHTRFHDIRCCLEICKLLRNVQLFINFE